MLVNFKVSEFFFVLKKKFSGNKIQWDIIMNSFNIVNFIIKW